MIDDDLRAALDARASTYTTSPLAWAEVQRRTRGARRRRLAGLAAVPLAAGAALAGLPLVLGTGGANTAATATPPTPAATFTYHDAYQAGTAQNPPIGESLHLTGEGTARTTMLWFSRTKDQAGDTRLQLCSATQLPSGGSTAGCADQPPPDGAGWYAGGTDSMLPRPAIVVMYGAAMNGTAKVAAITDGGKRYPGRIDQPPGAPRAIWSVRHPGAARVTAIELSDRNGKRLQRIIHLPDPLTATDAAPVGPVARLDGGVTARLHQDQSLVWWNGRKLIGLDVISSSPVVNAGETMAEALDGSGTPVQDRIAEGYWFGFARAGTARVTLTLPDGRSVSAETAADPWKQGAVLFSAPFDPDGDVYAAGFRVTGHAADGRELWRQDTPPVKPLWDGKPTASPAASSGGG
ncbi:hypothetical protein Sru01_37360 [Sphaerisporangium rufum]|uniref:Uncharacterized protein n=1 Tax=Sphaerisporangium rufum TaxID=1381558 RepID=A0A919R375_9ACTN|nr:hypothetical protein [Sphaerisporangium rufum]GII78754.1 hypothetical protein Sru01_37360 [Sphaerisporangium rufum]